MLQAARRLARRMQQKCIRPWQARFQNTKLPGIDLGEMSNFGQRAADERVVVMPVSLADAPHPLLGVLVTQMPSERVTGIRGIGDEAPTPHDLRRTADEPYLRVDGMQIEIFGGQRRLSCVCQLEVVGLA